MADKKDSRYRCCCGHITTVAKVIAIIGIVGYTFSFISAIYYWYYSPASLALLIVYVLVYLGITQRRPGYLLPAKIILCCFTAGVGASAVTLWCQFVAIAIVLNTLLIIALFILAFVLPSAFSVEIKSADMYYYSYYNKAIEQAKTALQVTLFVLAFVLLLAMSYAVFSFVVISRARKYLRETSTSSTVLPVSTTSSMYPNGCNK